MGTFRRRLLHLAAIVPLVGAAFAGFSTGGAAAPPTASTGTCTLNSAKGQIQHVIYIQFDNMHFTRDNPNVPSDLEQMPHLLNFIEGNGVLLSNHHTPLISHTATDILTSLTGVYGDRHGRAGREQLPLLQAGRHQRASASRSPTGPTRSSTRPHRPRPTPSSTC